MLKHYRISAESTMTPSARVSFPPGWTRGTHVELNPDVGGSLALRDV